MKYLLILSALFFISKSYAQKTISFEEADSLSKAGVFVMAKLDSVTHKIYYQIPTPDTLFVPFLYTPEKYDTVLVVVFMCDTSEYSGTTLNGNGIVFWQMGYEVRQMYSSFTSYNGVSVYDFDHIKYLTFDKKEFPKNIITWRQSKQY